MFTASKVTCVLPRDFSFLNKEFGKVKIIFQQLCSSMCSINVFYDIFLNICYFLIYRYRSTNLPGFWDRDHFPGVFSWHWSSGCRQSGQPRRGCRCGEQLSGGSLRFSLGWIRPSGVAPYGSSETASSGSTGTESQDLGFWQGPVSHPEEGHSLSVPEVHGGGESESTKGICAGHSDCQRWDKLLLQWDRAQLHGIQRLIQHLRRTGKYHLHLYTALGLYITLNICHNIVPWDKNTLSVI